MSKTIVSIVSAQPIPNYLVIKELYKPSDELLFIATTKTQDKIDYIVDTLKCDATITRVILKEGDEERWANMCQTIELALSPDKQYAVNLTGGTKYMALAAQNVFEKHNSTFYYIPNPKNVMLSSMKEIPISTRVNIVDYMALHGHNISTSKPIRDFGTAKRMLALFAHNFNSSDFEIIDKLRYYRDTKPIKISEIETKEDTPKRPSIPNLSTLIDKIKLVCEKDGQLTKYEVRYLTGGWFEEYVYFLIQTKIKPTDIALGVKLNSTDNDLDVVFTFGNKLFVIECKTGVDKIAMLNQIVYKSSALKEYLKGISAQSFIFALAKDDPQWRKIADHMGIGYYGRDYFLHTTKLNTLFTSIKAQD